VVCNFFICTKGNNVYFYEFDSHKTTFIQWYIVTLFNEYKTSCVFKYNTWYVGMLLDIIYKLINFLIAKEWREKKHIGIIHLKERGIILLETYARERKKCHSKYMSHGVRFFCCW
jgi:hypothetical protein